MEEQQYFEAFIAAVRDADMIVIGLGKEWESAEAQKCLQELWAFYQPYIEKKNYFFIASGTNADIWKGMFYEKRFVQPLLFQDETLSEEEKEAIEKQWDLYNKWLSATLNKKFVLLELGEGFQNPNIFRWPFEKITFINQKALLFRVNETFPQIPENIHDKAYAIGKKAYLFMEELRKFMQNTIK